jgi:hypothetical protein
MSAQGDLRDRLNEIAGMIPLSDRERKLAEWILYGDGEYNNATAVRAEPEWWGVEAVRAVNYLEPEE